MLMLQAMFNEKFSPELQENKAEIVDCILEQLQHMEDNIEKARKSDFKVSIHRLEVNVQQKLTNHMLIVFTMF